MDKGFWNLTRVSEEWFGADVMPEGGSTALQNENWTWNTIKIWLYQGCLVSIIPGDSGANQPRKVLYHRLSNSKTASWKPPTSKSRHMLCCQKPQIPENSMNKIDVLSLVRPLKRFHRLPGSDNHAG